MAAPPAVGARGDAGDNGSRVTPSTLDDDARDGVAGDQYADV